MNQAERTEFITELIDNVKVDILKESTKYPEHWDGIELRWHIADAFSQVVFSESGKRKGKRYQNYKNDILVNNFI